jgi:hypothetical protein
VVLAGCGGLARAAAPGLEEYKKAAVAIALGSAEGLELAGKVAEQKAAAEAHGKRLYGDAPIPHAETEHLLLYGKVHDRKLEDVGAILEKQLELARAALKMETDALWPGKLTVYFFPERAKFASFIRTVEKRRPDADDRGSVMIRSDLPHVAVGPAPESRDPSMEILAAQQLAAALIGKKVATGIPDWLVAGFGRATYFQAAPKAEQKTERRRAARMIGAKSVSATAVWDGAVRGEQAAVLRGSLADFLAFGPGKKKFIAFLEGFQPGEGMAMKSTLEAIKTAGMDPALVNRSWKIWVRRVGR